jgi:hypothetical protein
MDLAASVTVPDRVVPSGPSASAVTTDARQLAQSVSAFLRQKGGELIGGPGTSDASIGPIGPPSHNQSTPLEHVDGLTRGLAGVSHHIHHHRCGVGQDYGDADRLTCTTCSSRLL